MITSSKDLTARVFSLHPTKNFTPLILAGHRDAVVNVFFSHSDKRVRSCVSFILFVSY
jgi:periodic tryptophan protein 2